MGSFRCSLVEQRQTITKLQELFKIFMSKSYIFRILAAFLSGTGLRVVHGKCSIFNCLHFKMGDWAKLKI